MGAAYVSYSVGDLTDQQLKEDFRNKQERAGHDHGHGGYSGTIYEAQGLVIRRDKVFPTTLAADDWLNENAEKWGPAIAVRIVPAPGLKRPTDAQIKDAEQRFRSVDQALRDAREAPVRRIKNARAAHIGCKRCKSKLAKEYIRSTECPLCRGTLATATEEKRIETAKKKYEEGLERHRDFEQRRHGPLEPGWLVGAVCSE